MDSDALIRSATNLIDAGALVLFLPSLLLVALVSGPFARRWRTSRWVAALALASIAAILAITLRERDLLLWFQDIGAVISCTDCDRFSWITDGELWSGVAVVQSGWILNVLLFVPAGLLLSLATRRPGRSLVALIALSALVETIQDVMLLGSPDPADLVANALGAAIGVGAGAMALRLSPRAVGGAEGPAYSRRATIIGVAALLVIGSFGWLGLLAGADARQDALRNELQTAFAGTTASALEANLATEEGFDGVLGAATIRPMYLGRVGQTDQYEGLYATQFFGLYRCVIIRWTQTGLTLANGSDQTCTAFRDRPPES